MFVKETEKFMVGNQDAYISLRHKLESLPKNVVVIASHTQTDIHKEKVSSFPCGILPLLWNTYFAFLFI